MLFDFARPALFALDAERAHRLTVAALKVAPLGPTPDTGSLETEVAGIRFPNPLGMAAGFDKNGEVPDKLLALGLIGTVFFIGALSRLRVSLR